MLIRKTEYEDSNRGANATLMTVLLWWSVGVLLMEHPNLETFSFFKLGHSPFQIRPLFKAEFNGLGGPRTHIRIVSDVTPGTSEVRPQLCPALGPISFGHSQIQNRPVGGGQSPQALNIFAIAGSQ